jgi:hypothetical protein
MQAFNNNTYNAENTITVNGDGQVSAIPDIAVIRLGVQTEGENLAEIQARNAEISQAVLQALNQFELADIRTFQYQINKLYDFENGRQLDRGYSVRNIYELRTSMMTQVGMIIDTAVANGANIVELIEFELADSSSYYLEALKLALDNAFQKAYTIADSLGIQKEPVPVKITESSSLSVPPRPFIAREGGVFVTPVEPGSEQIEASVIVEFRY